MKETIPHQQGSKGFTLIELMIVVAIIGIIASIAIPRYESYVLRGNRAGDALPALNELMQAQERYAAQNGTYSADLTDLGYVEDLESPDGNYNLDAVVCADAGIAECVVVRALAKGNQVDDRNGNDADGDGKFGDITYSSRGEKTGLD